MTLSDFLRQTQAEVKAQVGERLTTSSDSYPYHELIFSEIVMQHMSDIAMTFEPEVCHCSTRIQNAILRLSGYAISEERDQLDLFVTLYSGADEVVSISDTETKTAAEQCLRFLQSCATGVLHNRIAETDDVYPVARTIRENYANLDQIRVYVLTDRQAKAKNFKPREVSGRTVRLEVVDIERLHRHWSEGKPRDEVIISFEDVCGGPLPCIYVPGEEIDYDYALTVLPGEALGSIYGRYGARLLEANVRSFLSVTGKVNRGVRDTLRQDPEHFMAYNNGIVIVADEVSFGTPSGGGTGICSLKGMQIVNGGQTTASVYFTKRKFPDTDLSKVRVPAKVIILRSCDASTEEGLISKISKYANSQNSVKESDLSANKPFHVEIEKLALTTYCPDGVGRWFYERAAGSYNTMLASEGNTAAKMNLLRTRVVPPSRKVSKTDLAKVLNAWDCVPHIVSLGSQKNFSEFMKQFRDEEDPPVALPGVSEYKVMIGKVIAFRTASKMIRGMFTAFQGNVTVYVFSLLADRFGDRVDFGRVWANQGLSPAFQEQIRTWAHEVNEVMGNNSGGRMISEWAKKQECWDSVRTARYSEPRGGIPEIN